MLIFLRLRLFVVDVPFCAAAAGATVTAAAPGVAAADSAPPWLRLRGRESKVEFLLRCSQTGTGSCAPDKMK